jgi:hypothetical protein
MLSTAKRGKGAKLNIRLYAHAHASMATAQKKKKQCKHGYIVAEAWACLGPSLFGKIVKLTGRADEWAVLLHP